MFNFVRRSVRKSTPCDEISLSRQRWPNSTQTARRPLYQVLTSGFSERKMNVSIFSGVHPQETMQVLINFICAF